MPELSFNTDLEFVPRFTPSQGKISLAQRHETEVLAMQRVLFRQAAKEESRRSEYAPVSITSAALAVDEASA